MTFAFQHKIPALLLGAATILTQMLWSHSVAAQLVQGQKFDDWKAKCEIPKGAAKQQCFIFQQLLMKQNGKQVLLVAVSMTDAQKARITLNVPLGVYLPAGLQLNVPGADPVKFVLQICLQNGCKAASLLPDALVKAMKSANKGSVILLNSQGRKVGLPVSLKGFTAGLAALVANAEAQLTPGASAPASSNH